MFASLRFSPLIPAVLAGVILCSSGAVHAQTTVSFVSTRDNTLYETMSGELSSGVGTSVFAGRTGAGGANSIRRAVLAFDVASTIPSGATITSAQLDVFCSRAAGGAQTMTLQRLTSDFGEGTSDAGFPGGAGAPSTANDATWLHTFYSGSLWATAGGDFVAPVSASTVVSGSDPYVFSSVQLAADVQDMLDSPANDFGWILRGNEVTTNTAKRFDSRETANPGSRPTLTVTYTAAPTQVPVGSESGWLLAGVLGAVGLLLLRRSQALA